MDLDTAIGCEMYPLIFVAEEVATNNVRIRSIKVLSKPCRSMVLNKYSCATLSYAFLKSGVTVQTGNGDL